jgi:ubiquinone/menaquinone biosynthesis C-methylase UbiE
MTKGLHHRAECYGKKLPLYQEFSYAEDSPGLITDFLKKRVKKLDIVDAGCSFGKILTTVAKEVKSAKGIDKSAEAISAAQRLASERSLYQDICNSLSQLPRDGDSKKEPLASENKNHTGLLTSTVANHDRETVSNRVVEYLCEDLTNLSLPSSTIDLVYASWVLGTITQLEERKQALDELIRITRRNGAIICIENAPGGEFEYIRGRSDDDRRTWEYNSWLRHQGFQSTTQITTYFEFSSLERAQSIFSQIWGHAAAGKVTSHQIEHPVEIFELNIDT